MYKQRNATYTSYSYFESADYIAIPNSCPHGDTHTFHGQCLCRDQGDRTITPNQCSQFEEGMRIQKDPNTRLSQYYKLTATKDPSTRIHNRCFKFEEATRIHSDPVANDTPHRQYYKLYHATTKRVTMPIFSTQPELHQGNIPPDPKADFKIYDRVVCSARNITPPFGAKGTITAIYQPSDSNTVRLSDKLNAEPSYQVMFDEPFPGGMKEDLFDDGTFYRMLPTNMINISHGRKLRSAVAVNVEDSRHSAFASYSPPANRNQYNSSYARDARNAPAETRNMQPPKQILSRSQPAPAVPATPATAQNSQEPDSATNLLRSLLKISENETDSAKRNNKNQNGQQNWRVKNDSTAPAPPPPQRSQQHPHQPHPVPHATEQNWRAENAIANNFNKNQRGPNEWTNNAYKNQPPVPPFPNFTPHPQPNQIPFPQFQNPHFQQRNHYQEPRFANQGQVRGQSFPKHLPNIGPNVTLGPSWNKDHSHQFLPTEHEKQRPQPPPTAQPANQASNSSYKINNPFVPLQVQTRRVHNQSGASTRRNLEEVPAPKSMAPESQPASQQVQKGPEAQKPQRKKKLRLAANLPFQID